MVNVPDLNQWIGKEQIIQAEIAPLTANLMQAALNREPDFKAGDTLPPAWHWLYFHEPIRADKLGLEGHTQLGDFMPPVDFGSDQPPRRMWAGGTIQFNEPIPIGASATKRSVIKSISAKEGRSGKLVFVIVEHEIGVMDKQCIVEQQTIVYREPVQAIDAFPPTAEPAPDNSEFSREYVPDPILLFRYSALTFNSHRIHYDLDFCRNQEGYPDLVVHGPLTATLLLDLFYHQFPDKQISAFEYRGRSPLFNPNPFSVHGQSDGKAWASNHQGGLAMSATISY